MNSWTAPRLTPDAARALQSRLRTTIAPGLSERELDAVEARFGFTFAADHRVFLSVGLPNGSPHWPDWRDGDPEDLAWRLARPVEGALFDVEHNGLWHPLWPPRPDATAEALRVARAELAHVPRLIPVYSHRYLPGTPGQHGHPVLSVWQTDIIVYGNDLTDYLRAEFGGPPSNALARTTVDFWSYFVEGGPGVDTSLPTPFTPYATTAREAVDCLRMLAVERLTGRPHYPEQFVEAGVTALVLGVETESLPLLAGLTRAEGERAEGLFDRVVDELGLRPGLPADTTGLPWEAARWELVRWWLGLVDNGSLAPGTGADLVVYEGWANLGRPESLRPLVDLTEAYDDWSALARGDREDLVEPLVQEVRRLLAGPWPPSGGAAVSSGSGR
ncbi:hypothetical protein [Streptomyces sp. NPDC048659]|uniref:hypothetical protein n=1 Tax=Streptomyces sp. NPDC048659 TaxID=3155489 RepID=UPI003441AFED